MSHRSPVLAIALLTMSACGGVMDAEPRIGSGSRLGGAGPLNAGTGWPGDGGQAALPASTGGAGAGAAGLIGGQAGLPGAGGLDPGAPVDATLSGENPCGSGPEPLATDLRIRELALYQTVKIPLFKDGAWLTTRNASAVQGKKMLLRTFVEPLAGYRTRSLHAVLTLDNDGQRKHLSVDKSVAAASTDEAADSTFDFTVEGALIGPNTQLSVSILEPTCPAQPASGSGARVPATGLQALGATRIGTLRVVFVPVSIGGRVPDTGEQQLAKFRDELLAYYPVAQVEVTAHAPIIWPNGLTATSTSAWSELLNQIGLERQRDAPAREVYYYGLVAPAASFSTYCRASCILGLAPQTTFVSPPDQIGLGVGFVNANTYATAVHEIGHAHGRAHAPCVPEGGFIEGADPSFPYSGGKIGSWGWDSRSGQLLSPTRYVDVMGYCDPTWISDFTYEGLAARSRDVNTAARIITNKSAATTWQRVILFADGRARWAGVSTTETPADLSRASAFDVAGQALDDVPVARVPLSHSADAFLYVPEPEPAWAWLELGDRNLVRAEIEPAQRR